jgi:2-polyprenyl-3-methyl-5-hydroxy-6-metoxy-1,4-benzoquinol methylase
MNCCKSRQCQGIEDVFNDSMANSDLENYIKNGPNEDTRRLLGAIRPRLQPGFSLLDVGGGVGTIQHELAAAGAASIVNVDASPAYSQTARQEAARRGYSDRVSYHVGDFTQISPSLDPADVVTLDRVICCYDDMPALVQAASARARSMLGLVYPRDTWYIKLGVHIANLVMGLLRRRFQIFAHPTVEVERLIRSVGFERSYHHKGFFWQVAVYEK